MTRLTQMAGAGAATCHAADPNGHRCTYYCPVNGSERAAVARDQELLQLLQRFSRNPRVLSVADARAEPVDRVAPGHDLLAEVPGSRQSVP